ncbi:unnamed protein product [Paramecium octaurelia]|uniref:C3H1-type domain-containing protein n=1 Tax=Paramecium octaurelia TaxID=43137 RepID=A0A8S1ST66_PAROT|nr:unnamed protein product [Paramecium octaurelia]
MASHCNTTPQKMLQNYSTDHSQMYVSTCSDGSDQDTENLIKQPTIRKKSFATPGDKNDQSDGKRQQLRTKICRNFQEKGYCQYKDKCSFIHEPHRIENFGNKRTKPCRSFFSTGVCPLGLNCQYAHYEVIDKEELRDFVEKTFREQKLMVPLHPNKLQLDMRNDLQRFQHLYKIFGRKLSFRRDDLLVNICRERNSIFLRLCQSEVQEFTNFLQ